MTPVAPVANLQERLAEGERKIAERDDQILKLKGKTNLKLKSNLNLEIARRALTLRQIVLLRQFRQNAI